MERQRFSQSGHRILDEARVVTESDILEQEERWRGYQEAHVPTLVPIVDGDGWKVHGLGDVISPARRAYLHQRAGDIEIERTKTPGFERIRSAVSGIIGLLKE